MDQTLKITSTLADATRFSIYQFIIQHQAEVSVQEIAEQFNIHPNVARLHLSKLEEVNVITSELRKTGKGGRPGKMYKAAEQVVQLSFPHRDYQLLATIALKALANMGEAGEAKAQDTALAMGKQFMEQRTSSGKKGFLSLAQEDKMKYLQEVSSMIGYFPKLVEKDGQMHIRFVIYNCPFKESLDTQGEMACLIHTAFLKGAFNYLFEDMSFEQSESMTEGCRDCIYHLTVTN